MSNHAENEERPARLLPARQLPPYSYVTGKFPHPTRDEAGHSFGAPEPKAAIASESAWRQCDEYLWGIDLFNNGYYWEAHEAWEAVWHAAGRRGPVADFLKALIKLAAAGVKAREGRSQGVKQHAERARQLFASVESAADRQGQRWMGLSLATLKRDAETLIGEPDSIVDTADKAVVVVMPFTLQPE